ncbi:MAG: hypothetical protein GY861_16750 [bacterium]|nr:hypothetical protein [bacterium]
MNLLQLRTKFIELSGRYDLIVDAVDFVDNGADFYINAGMNMLDRMVKVPESRAKLYYPLAVGNYSLTFQHNCRLITDVWVNNTENRWKLEKVSLSELKAFYNEIAGDVDNGMPRYFALAELRALETTDKSTLGTFIDKTWAETDSNYDYRGIIIAPPPDKAYTVEVNGLFKQVELSSDSDENYWLLQEADLLLRAALYKLEVMSRGTENAKNWLSAIRDDVREINYDLIEEESHDIDQLEG